MIKVFFDASVLFSAIYSSTGASAKLAELTKKKAIVGFTSQTVIEELKQNVKKLPGNKRKIDHFIIQNNFIVREKILDSETKSFDFVERKDAHVVAGASLTKSNYLVTLDKKHLNNPKLKRKIKKFKIISPKEMLIAFLNIS